jgi:hypothetical protein
MRAAALALLLSILASACQGAEVRPATDQEFARLLLGCWLHRDEYLSGRACFDQRGVVETMVFGSYEGFDGRGHYEVSGGMLTLRGDHFEGWTWLFNRTQLACDALIEPGIRLALVNCRGGNAASGGIAENSEALPDLGFRAVPPFEDWTPVDGYGDRLD